MYTQVIDIGDHDYCIAHTAVQTQWLAANWSYFEKHGQLSWAFKELIKLVRNGPLAVKIFNAMSSLDYVKVRWLLDRAADWDRCFVYAIDDVGRVKWRGPKLRPVHDRNHINLVGIIPGHYDYVETKLKHQKYLRVQGYP